MRISPSDRSLGKTTDRVQPECRGRQDSASGLLSKHGRSSQCLRRRPHVRLPWSTSSPVSRVSPPWAMTEVRVWGSRHRKVGPHREPPRHPRSGSTSTTSCVPVAVTIARTVNLESYDGSKRNQSASSSLCQVPDVPRSRFPTLGSVPGQALSPTTAREGLALARQRALLPSRVDCDLGKPSILACGRGIITRSGRYEAGGSFALQGIRSLLDWRSGTEFLPISLSISLPISSFYRLSLAYFVCCLPGRGGRGGNGQLPKSGSQLGLHPAPPCHTKRAPSSACKSFGSPPAPSRAQVLLKSREPCAQTSRCSQYAILTCKSSHAGRGEAGRVKELLVNGFSIPSDVAKTPFCERRDS